MAVYSFVETILWKVWLFMTGLQAVDLFLTGHEAVDSFYNNYQKFK